MLRKWLPLFLIAPLPAAVGLAQDGFFSSSDGMIHLYRLFEIDRAVHAGVLYPRWFPLSGYGYGLPVLNYYPPLAYYVAELFHLAGAGYVESIKLLVALGFVAALFSMFLFTRDIIGDVPAMVAGIAYAYSPYILSDAYVRGNFPEFLAVCIAPLVLWGFRRIFVSDFEIPAGIGRFKVGFRYLGVMVAAGLPFAIVILSHHLTALLLSALLLGYILFLFAIRRDWARLLLSGGAILFALVLSAVYWLPSLAELNLVYVGPASVARFLVSRLVSIQDLVAPSLAYVYLPQSEALKHISGFPQTLLALLTGFAAAVLLLNKSRPAGRSSLLFHSVFFSLVVLAALFMTWSVSSPLWYIVPVLRFMQFPWRFEILSGIGVAFLLGVCAKGIATVASKYNAAGSMCAVASVALVALGIANLPVRTIPLTDDAVNLLWSGDSDYVVSQMGWGWTREFVPATVQDSESVYAPATKVSPPPSLSALSIPGVQMRTEGLFTTALSVSTAQPLDISLHAFYFPGWQASVDGSRVPTFPRGTLGLVSATVPPGDHVIRFDFEDTPLRSLSNWISFAALVGAFLWLVVAHRPVAFGIAGALGLLALIWIWHVYSSPAGLNAATPVPLARPANLDDRIMLIGYSIGQEGHADRDTIHLTLYWFALQEMDNNYQVFVHLTGERDQLVGQQDGPPDQGLTPTTRWLPGEVVADRHVLTAAAPGEYHLTTGMYLPGENGYVDLGVPIDLGKVEVQ